VDDFGHLSKCVRAGAGTMSRKSGNAGNGIGALVFFILFLIAAIPKEVWIALGVVAGLAVVVAAISWGIKKYEEHRTAVEAAAERAREERARWERQHRVDTLGKENAALVESALVVIEELSRTEAARAGWLGDIDFSADIAAVTANLEKAHALRGVINELRALKNPSDDDRKILAEARATAGELESAARTRLDLIGRCAQEARLIDKSLQDEREHARTEAQRAELHARLSAMLYGIEKAPDGAPRDSAADAVMARVQAYRDIKNQIQLAQTSAEAMSTRKVRCFNCGHVQHVLASATVMHCVNCDVRMKPKQRTR